MARRGRTARKAKKALKPDERLTPALASPTAARNSGPRFFLTGLRHGAMSRSLARCFWHPEKMTAFLFSCENATCAVPEAYREIFRGSEDVVASAEGWEPGSLNLGQAFAMKFRTPLVHGDVTRLLIDFEKDGGERWSRFSIKLAEGARAKLVERHEKPYRAQLMQRIGDDMRRNERVMHVMIHTDAATEGRVTLETPAGAALAEHLAAAWRARLHAAGLDVLHLRNCLGTALGNTLAREFPAERYAQVRLAVSQSFFLEGRPLRWEMVKKRLLDTLSSAVADAGPVSGQESPWTAPG